MKVGIGGGSDVHVDVLMTVGVSVVGTIGVDVGLGVKVGIGVTLGVAVGVAVDVPETRVVAVSVAASAIAWAAVGSGCVAVAVGVFVSPLAIVVMPGVGLPGHHSGNVGWRMLTSTMSVITATARVAKAQNKGPPWRCFLASAPRVWGKNVVRSPCNRAGKVKRREPSRAGPHSLDALVTVKLRASPVPPQDHTPRCCG